MFAVRCQAAGWLAAGCLAAGRLTHGYLAAGWLGVWLLAGWLAAGWLDGWLGARLRAPGQVRVKPRSVGLVLQTTYYRLQA